MKQETLEEAAELFADDEPTCDYDEGIKTGKYQGFIEGAKWQQEQNNTKYTEEEVIEYTIYVLLNGLITPKMWFEQVKKK